MSCNYSGRDETVLAYVRQELNPEAQEAFEAHYFVCEECATEVLFYEKTVLTMQGQGGIVFTRSKQSRFEWLVTMQHFINRWSESLAGALGSGGSIRAVAGYAVLVVFLSAGSFWLIKATNPSPRSSAEKLPSAFATLAPETTHNPSLQKKSRNKIHLDWPRDLKMTNDLALQARLDAIQPIYQVQRDYEAAGDSLAFLADDFSGESSKLFLAVCLSNQEEHESEAIALLETLKNSRISSYRERAIEVLALLTKDDE